MATSVVQSGNLAEDIENLSTPNDNTPEESDLTIAEQAESKDNEKAAESLESKDVVKAADMADGEQNTALASPTTTASPVVSEKAAKSAKKKAKKEDGYSAEQLDDRFHRIIYQLGLNPTYEIPVVLGVTSAVRGEGRTTVAMGLAKAVTQLMPVRVVVVETDLENPALAQDLNLQSHGLSEFMRGEVEVEEVIQSTNQPDLFVVTAGDAQGQVLKTLRNENLGHLIENLRQQFALVLLDLPPLADTGEVTRAMSQTDFVLMIVQAGSTPGKMVKSSLELVPEDKLIGVVLNRTKPALGIWGVFRRFFRR